MFPEAPRIEGPILEAFFGRLVSWRRSHPASGSYAARTKKNGRSKIRTAIREEPVKMAQYLREEKESHEPVEIR